MAKHEPGFSLRESKQAKTKIFLVKEFLHSLKDTRYENISIKSICEKAEVSEGTFYNYFPQKTDMFNYIIGLFGTRTILDTNKKASEDDPVRWLKVYFENVVKMMAVLGDLSNEILATVIRERVKPQKIKISTLEFICMFPEIKGDEELKDSFSIDDCFNRVVEEMAVKGLLKKNISNQDLALALKLILGGIPLIRAIHEEEDLGQIVQKQLSMLLEGVIK